jgi:hypothetical protein
VPLLLEQQLRVPSGQGPISLTSNEMPKSSYNPIDWMDFGSWFRGGTAENDPPIVAVDDVESANRKNDEKTGNYDVDYSELVPSKVAEKSVKRFRTD